MSFLNPSLRLTTLNDLMKFSPLTGTDSSVFAIMKIGVLKALIDTNIIKHYKNNRGAQRFSKKTI